VTPVPVWVCVSTSSAISSAYKKYEGTSPRKGRNIVSRTMTICDLGGSICTSITFRSVDQISPTFFDQRRRGCSWWTTFSIFDLWIRSADICDQSRKLSEIAPDFERFSPSQILGGRPSKNCTHIITPSSRHGVWIKILDDIPISPDVIDVHTLNFKPNFKFSGLKFLRRPPSQLECALGSIGQSLASVKISGRSTP